MQYAIQVEAIGAYFGRKAINGHVKCHSAGIPIASCILTGDSVPSYQWLSARKT